MKLIFYIENKIADKVNPNIRGGKETLETMEQEIMFAIEPIKSTRL